MRNKSRNLSVALVEPTSRWVGTDVLATVRRLNSRYIDSLARMGEAAPSFRQANGVCECPKLWTRVDARVCERVARCPVLLLDLNVPPIDGWHRNFGSADSDDLRATRPAFVRERAIPLVREILTEAWRIARSTPRVASVVFGMAPDMAAGVSRLAPSDIDRIAANHAFVRPRWAERPGFWTGLLSAAVGTDDQALANMHLYALQLLGGDLVSGSGASSLLSMRDSA